ncbi:hypothetical protein QQ045_016763 [Rhodiola kirilowii]
MRESMKLMMRSKDELEGLDCIQIPGCNRVQKTDHSKSFDRDCPGYLWFIDIAKGIVVSDGIIVNSWHDLEPTAILDEAIDGRVYPVGPLVKHPTLIDVVATHEINEVFRWMDEQPDQSVLYVSYGSGGSLTFDKIQELALGLELSQQRFIWVLRPPLDKDVSELFLSIDIGVVPWITCPPVSWRVLTT